MNSGRTISILQVAASSDRSGGGTYLLELARGLDRTRFRTSLACPTAGPLTESLRPLDVPVHFLPMDGISLFSAAFRLRRLIRRENFDLVQSHGLRPNVLARLAAAGLGVPVISTYHVSPAYADVPFWKRFVYTTLDQATRSWSSLCLFVSGSLKEAVAPSDSVRSTVIPNGVDTRRFDPGLFSPSQAKASLHAQGERTIVTIGRLSSEKGHRFLLNALAHLARSGFSVKVFFAGDGPLKNSLIEQVRHLGLDKSCVFLGSRTDIPEILAAADLVVVPSLIEGLPYVVLEAMAMEKCVLASPVGGNKELLKDGVNGFLTEVEKPEVLAQKIQELLKNPSLCHKVGQEARKSIKNQYDLEIWSNRLHTLYEEMASKVTRS